MGIRVGAAVAALAHITVGRSGAGRGDGLRVVFGIRADCRIAALADQIHRVLGFGGFYILGRGFAHMVGGVGVAVVALANITVGRFGAGGGGGWRVGLGRSLSRLSTAVVVHRWRVLGFGGLKIGGRVRANVVGRVGVAVAAPAHIAVGRRGAGRLILFGVLLVIGRSNLSAACTGFRHHVLGCRA